MQLANARESTGWVRVEWTRNPTQSLSTNMNNIADEMFLILRHIAEVTDEGVRVIKSHSPGLSDADAKTRHPKVRAFIRQAENFYRAGHRTPYRTSALLYYYAFMNLVKASLAARGISYDPYHGLSRTDPMADDLDKLGVDIKSGGVFPALYQTEFGKAWPTGLQPRIGRLLVYVTDIGFQCQRTGLASPGSSPIAPCKLRVVVNDDPAKKECWLELAVRRELDITSCTTMFTNVFEEVALSPYDARERYAFYAEALPVYRFYQSTVLPFPGQTPVSALRTLLYSALDSAVEPLYVGTELDLMVSGPYAAGNLSSPMSELVAIYLVMFYLGSLVRYAPDYLDDLLGAKNSYVLESFVNSAPHVALRALTARIAGENFIFDR
jgi:hypothetical protein